MQFAPSRALVRTALRTSHSPSHSITLPSRPLPCPPVMQMPQPAVNTRGALRKPYLRPLMTATPM